MPMLVSHCTALTAILVRLCSMQRRVNSKVEGTIATSEKTFEIDSFSFHFKTNSVDEFMIECPNVGELTKILIGHNNKGSAPGWFLDRVLVEDMEENRIYEFTCNRWLATDEDDGQISRFLLPKKTTRDGREASDGKTNFDFSHIFLSFPLTLT